MQCLCGCCLTLSTSTLEITEHDYERNYAVYKFSLATGASSGAPGSAVPEVIRNATAPVYIVEGCAGDVEHHEPFTRPQPKYSGAWCARLPTPFQLPL